MVIAPTMPRGYALALLAGDEMRMMAVSRSRFFDQGRPTIAPFCGSTLLVESGVEDEREGGAKPFRENGRIGMSCHGESQCEAGIG